ncbi:MAG: 50S ribosomal protein L17 [Candidatus Obscuribacterales bacterium]|nr:50S ribosomal protein L17 [Candidatus Obscuribacterales bacterium]
MRHCKPGNRLSRPADQRKALLRSLATELLRHDEIKTTLSKAKAVRGEAERMITLAKRGQVADYPATVKKARERDKDAAKIIASAVHCRRQVASVIFDKAVVTKVFEETAPRYKDRKGGYTRIIKDGYRRGDNAPMAIIQLV